MTIDAAMDLLRSLPPDDRRIVAETLLDELDGQELTDSFELTESHKRELDRRLAEIDSDPDDEVSWDDLKAEMLEEFRKCPSN